ncbi:MAG: cytochrome P450 [Leptolyngbyaceae bacterium]|nr:cytochrome P450 [Leptolyngbyaceae bacterium]
MTSSPTPLPPGSSGLPFLGETLNFFLDPDFVGKRQIKYGPIFRTHLLGRPSVMMLGPEANEFILSSHMDHFTWNGGWPDTFRELLGESLFLQDGEKHLQTRRLLMPAFHGRALEGYFQTMLGLSNRYLHQWEQLGTFTWLKEMKRFTFEVASVLLVGGQPGDQQIGQLSHWFTELTNGLFMPPIRWSWLPYGKAIRARDQLLAHIEQTIEQRRATPGNDALSLLLQTEDEAGNRLSLAEIKVQVLLMLFAGHETSTSMLTSLVMSLAQYPEVWAKALAEQDALAAQGPLSMDQLRAMPYLDQMLKEVERLYPPVGAGFRKVVKPFEFNGYHVPAGWTVVYPINAAHRDPRCYTNWQAFDPDRFGPDRAEHKRFEYSLVGFGGGPRRCIGFAFAQMEMKILAAQLLRHYTWTLTPEQNLMMMPVPTLHPASGLEVTLRRR